MPSILEACIFVPTRTERKINLSSRYFLTIAAAPPMGINFVGTRKVQCNDDDVALMACRLSRLL